MYQKLRQLCMSKELQADWPEWPFPLLFHGVEVTRDFFFLNPLIEYRILPLGKNVACDGGSIRYRSLNYWFHYEFFNAGGSPIACSAETTGLLLRLMRLRRVLLDGSAKPAMARFLKQKLGVTDTPQLISSFLTTVAQMIQICSEQRLVVWGTAMDATSASEQSDYISNVLSKIPIDLVLNLPHIRDSLRETKFIIDNDEAKLLERAELRFNKRSKSSLNSQQSTVSRDNRVARRR